MAELDIYKFLATLNKGDTEAYTNLSDDEKKAAAPLIAMRWLSGSRDPAQIIQLNEFVNPYVFSASKEVAFRLIAAACRGSDYRWIKGPGNSKFKNAINLIARYYECSYTEAKGHLEFLDLDSIKVMAEELGTEEADLKKILKEFEDDSGPSAAKTGGRKKASKPAAR